MDFVVAIALGITFNLLILPFIQLIPTMNANTVVLKPLFFSLLLIIASSLCSFSSVPVAEERDGAPPVETKQETRRQSRLNKRYNRLYQRFERTTHTKQRLRLQKKIRQVERQQNRPGSAALGVVGLGLGVVSFMFFLAASFSFLPGYYAMALLFAIAALTVSITFTSLRKKYPERYILKGFGIAGIIIASVLLAFSSLAAAATAAFW